MLDISGGQMLVISPLENSKTEPPFSHLDIEVNYWGVMFSITPAMGIWRVITLLGERYRAQSNEEIQYEKPYLSFINFVIRNYFRAGGSTSKGYDNKG